MPLQGNIRDFSTIQLLNLVNLSRRTGMLTIFESVPTGEKDAMKNEKMAPGAERANVAFNNGKLVYASLAGQDDGLVAVLNKAGKLTDEQARILKQRAKNTSDKALAMRLIGAKYVSQADIVNCIKQHILDVVYNLMTWTDGPFRFDDSARPAKKQILVPIDLENVIIEGARVSEKVSEINTVIDSLDVSLRFPENPKEKFKGIHLSVDEWKVVSYVNPKNTLRQIMKVLNMSEIEIKRVVYGLYQAGLVEVVRKRPTAASGKSKSGRRRRQARGAKPDKKVINKLIDKLKSI
jgi:DNA-binding transcriptional regulator YhcF (GntR family)